MNANSPIDPLYWFKNIPPNIIMTARAEDGTIFHLPQLDKWRFVSQKEQDGMFLCEIVGNISCGLRFFLPEVAIAAAERVSD